MNETFCIPKRVNSINLESLRNSVQSAKPFPFFFIDNFLDEDFANEVLNSFPTLEEAKAVGRSFNAVNEKGKTQITDSKAFAKPIQELNRTLSSREWLEALGYVMAIPNLQADEALVGGGIHQTGPRGHLDVHIDFNYIANRKLHRRLNILVYFNKNWTKGWGGEIELWDEDVRACQHSFLPIFNRCVVFATNEISYHGVTAVKCPPGNSRKSFAAYYYTSEAPAGWDGTSHSTIFKARPNEIMKKLWSMPVENMKRAMNVGVAGLKKAFRPKSRNK